MPCKRTANFPEDRNRWWHPRQFATFIQRFCHCADGARKFPVRREGLFFDVFGTLVDWRTGVARDAESHLKPLGYEIDWLAFADAWRAGYGPAMEEVRAGRIPFSKLDVLHRHILDGILPRFGMTDLPEDVRCSLNLAWHRLDAWPDVSPSSPN